MFNALQPWHIIVLVVVLIALFGAKRLPDAARGIGKSMHIFKAEAQSLRDEHEAAIEPENNPEEPNHHQDQHTERSGSDTDSQQRTESTKADTTS